MYKSQNIGYARDSTQKDQILLIKINTLEYGKFMLDLN